MSANLSLQAKSGPFPVLENKVLLEYIHVYIVYGCFLTIMAELNSSDRDHIKYLPSGPLQKKLTDHRKKTMATLRVGIWVSMRAA